MSMFKTQRSRVAQLKAQTETLFAEVEAKGEGATQEERNKLRDMIADLGRQSETLKALEAAEKGVAEEVPAPVASPVASNERKTIGQRFIESKEFKGRASNGAVRADMQIKADEIVGVTGVASTQAFPVWSQRLSEVFPIARTGLELLAAFGRGETNSNSFEYMTQATRTNNAAETQELSSKPQSVLDWDVATATVRTIAHWVAATEQVLDDEPRLRGMIDDELVYGVQKRLQSQLISGNGSAPNLRGLINTSSTNNRVHATSGSRFSANDTIGDTIRRMLTDIQIADGVANLVLLNPADAEKLDVQREGAGTGQYLRTYDVVAGRIWRVPVLEANDVTAGTALAGDFARGCKYYVRQDVTVSTGFVNDQYIKNTFTIRAEMRAAFAVFYPAWFSKATSLA